MNESTSSAPGWRRVLRHDLLASVVVFLVALPLCMGIAIASGLPPATGLLTGIIGGIVVGSISGSPLQVSGPAAGLVVIVFEIVQRFGVEMLAVVIMGAGVIQFIAGQLKLGQWFRAMAPAVVYAMLAGIGVLIFSSQFHVMVDDLPKANGVLNLINIPSALMKAMWASRDNQHHLAAMLGLATVLSIVIWGRFAPRFLKAVPGPLIGVVNAVFLAHVLEIPVKYVDVPDNLWATISWPSFNGDFSNFGWPVTGAIIATAFVASAETLLCAGAVDRMQSEVRTDYDKELSAQGVGNMLCGAVGALPMTGVIVRSSANVGAGGKTRASAILHGIWLLILVTAAPGILRTIPTASLAAILVYTGYKLVNPAHIRELKAYGRGGLVIYGVTIVTIVVTDLLTGVVLGFCLSLGRLLMLLSKMEVLLEYTADQKRVDVRVEGAATFMSLPKLVRRLDEVPTEISDIHVHVEKVSFIDHAAMQALSDWQKRHAAEGRKVTLEWQRLYGRSERIEEAPAE